MKKKSVRRKSPTKWRRARREEQPETGLAGPGEAIDPMAVPENCEANEANRRQPRSVPAPGVPVSDQEYEHLKEKARVARKRSVKHAQEDPSKKT